MGSFSDDTERRILDHVVGKTTFTMPTAYIGLSTADPLDDESGLAEPSGMGYARVVTNAADWNAAIEGSPSSISNALDITFPEASGDWGIITHFALFSAATGVDVMMAHGSLTSSKHIESGEIAKFSGGTPGDLVLTLD